MKSDALAFLTMTVLVAATFSEPPVRADVTSVDTARIRQYQDQSIDFAAQGSQSYSLRQGGREIDDLSLATASGNVDLVTEVRQARRGRHAYQLAVGVVGIPLGLLIAADNFFGKRTGPKQVGSLTLPPSIVAPFAASDPLSFALSVGGAVLALYGAWQIGALVGEAAGTYHPTYLSPDEAKAAVDAYDHSLAGDLGLNATEVAEATPEASPSPTPNPIPEGFPAGEEGSGCWAVQQAVPFIHDHLGSDLQPFLVWTQDLHDFQTGLVQTGAWHVVFAAANPADDVDAAVPIHGGGITWTGAKPFFTRYRAGTDLLDTVKVDSPRAMFLLKQPFVDRQVGWLTPGSVVVLYPFWGRLHDPVWTVHLGYQRLPPVVGIDAEFGTLVDMSRFRL